MIVATDGLAELAGRVSMVDGGFDPLHPGHTRYFAAAAALGDPVLCNVAPDAWVARKHPPLLAQEQRGELIDAFADVAYVHLAKGSTEDVLRALRPRRYVKGADWRGTLPAEQVEICAELGIEVVYLDTVFGSSSELLRSWAEASP